MAANKVAVNAKAKAKRQKIILAVLGVVFLGVLAWQVPSVLKIMNKKPPVAATTPPAAVVPGTPVPPVSGTPVSATPTPGAGLIDSDPAAQAAGGQLVTFDRFSSKDPFQQQARIAAATSSAPADPPADPKPKVGVTASSDTKPPPPPPAPAPTSAQISVNGSSETVSKGGTFPQADPVFVLVSVSRTTAQVAISGGSLDSGGATLTLKKGKKLTLENTVDSARYVLLLVSTG
jgi:hypothetical protein